MNDTRPEKLMSLAAAMSLSGVIAAIALNPSFGLLLLMLGLWTVIVGFRAYRSKLRTCTRCSTTLLQKYDFCPNCGTAGAPPGPRPHTGPDDAA